MPKLPTGFHPIDLDALRALPSRSVVFLFDQEDPEINSPIISTHALLQNNGDYYLHNLHSGRVERLSNIANSFKGFALPNDLGF